MFVGVVMETEVAITDNHENVAGAGTAGGEDLYR